MDGVTLLDVDPGATTNRTVVTFVGPPGPVEEAAFRAIRKAAELIDMSRHRGEHARIGATDVCPFVPLEGATMEDCVAIARSLGTRVGEELGIPVYLYERAATRPERRALADIRQGEYEALPRKLLDPAFAPDFGPARFHARAGATVIGAREFLVAYNVNLNTRDRRLAQRIATAIRETGRPRRGPDGAVLRDQHGTPHREPGRFRGVRAVGWYIEEYGRAQVSINLTDLTVSPLHEVFDACVEEAAALGLRVTGSEVVGLVPLRALLQAGDAYLARQGKTSGVPEAERVAMAVTTLGLSELAPFDPAKKVVEYRARGEAHRLVSRTLTSFLDELSSESPAPGGGSVAALTGALSASLSSMVAALTWAKKGMEAEQPAMEDLGRRAQALKDWFRDAVDRDTRAFEEVLAATRLPRGTDDERAARDRAMAEANRRATEVPREVLEKAVEAADLAVEVARRGNPASVSDAGVGAILAGAAADGASLNVRINLPGLADAGAREAVERRRARALEAVRARVAEARDAVDGALAPVGS